MLQLNKPAYIRLSRKKVHHTLSMEWLPNINVKDGNVIVDVAKDGSIVGIEILNKKYEIRINGTTIYPNLLSMPRRKK